jgi:ATP-binding cassette, subfamily C, bacterial CydD
MTDGTVTAKTWLKGEQARGLRAAIPLVALGLLQTALGVGQAASAGLILASLFRHGAILLPVIGFIGFAALRVSVALVADRRSFELGAGARRRLRSRVLAGLLAAGPFWAPPGGAGRLHTGDAATLAVDGVEAMDGLHARWLPSMVLAYAAPWVIVIAAGIVDRPSALVFVLAGALVLAGMALAGIGAAVATRGQFVALSRLQVRFLDRIRGIGTIVLAGRTEDEARALGATAATLRRFTMRVLRVAFLSSSVLDLAAAGTLIAVVLRFAMRPAHLDVEHLDAARALFVLLLVPEFFAPLRAFSAVYQDRRMAEVVGERFASLPEAPPPVPQAEIRVVKAQGAAVAFEEVTFGWSAAGPSGRPPVIDSLSYRLPAGETLLLVGPSGSGKSTVIDLLIGFLAPQSGRITVNGADAATLIPEARTRLIAWIGQKPAIFAASIAENIRFARPEASDEELAEVVRLARLDAVVQALPDGLDTKLGEGGYGLSGGQAQRVAIARAFLKDAPLLLLDEPTAHLDPATERDILDSLKRLAIGRTVVLATHSALAHEFARGMGARQLDLATAHLRTRGVA